ncbi:MAG: hypothetical protein FJX25_11465 [Alphaproteobacteria bacterium]|nr:hypothetical protein [Alphaproteobacteria bacterium]
MAITIADPLELRVVEMINAERADADLPPVHTEVHLNSSAQGHSDWMAQEGVLSHPGRDGSTVTDRAQDAEFPMEGASWSLRENLAYTSVQGSLNEGELVSMHDALMNSASHKANILDPDVSYVGVGLSQGQIESGGQTHDVVFLTQNFGNSSLPVLVQEEIEGEIMLTSYLDGEAVPGSSQPAPDQTDGDGQEDDGEPGTDDDDPQDRENGSGGSCFVATAAYGDRMHPDVVTLRAFRDQILVRHRMGRGFVRAYWIIGPKLARLVRPDDAAGQVTRWMLRPCVAAARRTLARRR